jgi:catechol 2,3-dioxygenase-like lactoylglutathione lyase family enzyme
VDRVTIQRMDNVGIVVESLDAAISFFAELGLELEGRATIEGDWSGRVTGLRDQRVEIAMMRTPDGHSRLELSRFLAPPVVADHRNAPVNALGYLRVMFAVEDIDDTLARLRPHGAKLVDEVAQYEDQYRLCYIRGAEGSSSGLPSRSASGLNRFGPIRTTTAHSYSSVGGRAGAACHCDARRDAKSTLPRASIMALALRGRTQSAFAADFHSRRRCAMTSARSSSLPPSSTWRSEGSARK